jgi:hypothetical protein
MSLFFRVFMAAIAAQLDAKNGQQIADNMTDELNRLANP